MTTTSTTTITRILIASHVALFLTNQQMNRAVQVQLLPCLATTTTTTINTASQLGWCKPSLLLSLRPTNNKSHMLRCASSTMNTIHSQDTRDLNFQEFDAVELKHAKRVVLVRHGQSTWNHEGRIQGSSNFSVLTEKGEIEAETARQMLLDDTFDVCFHSPLTRSKRTAEIIWDSRKTNMIPDNDLREIDLYSFQGLLKEEGKRQFGEAFTQWQKDAANFVIDNHYPVRELWDRARKSWKRILSDKSQSVLVVAHNAVNQALVATALGLGPQYFRILLQSNCGVTVLDFTPNVIAERPPYVSINRLNQTPNSPITPQSGGRKARDRVVLVCHGSTTSISERSLSSGMDEPLNMLGIIQSQKTAELLLDLRVDLIFSGPQHAAKKTAATIEQVQEAADCLGADCEPRYVEVKVMQDLEDHEWESVVNQLKVSTHKKWQDYLQHGLSQCEELLAPLWGRTQKAWKGVTDCLKTMPGDASNVIIVGSEISHVALLCHCLGLDKSHIGMFSLDAGSISVIDFPDGPEGRGVIRCLNYTAHLGRWSVPVTRPSMADEEF